MLLRGKSLIAVKEGAFIDVICDNVILQQLKLQLESQCCVSSSIAGAASQSIIEDNKHTTVVINASGFFMSLYPW